MSYIELDKLTKRLESKRLRTRKELAGFLAEIQRYAGQDREMAHSLADDALLSYIGDEQVTLAFNAEEWWYA